MLYFCQNDTVMEIAENLYPDGVVFVQKGSVLTNTSVLVELKTHRCADLNTGVLQALCALR